MKNRDKIFSFIFLIYIFALIIIIPIKFIGGKEVENSVLGNKKTPRDFTGKLFSSTLNKIEKTQVDLENNLIMNFPYYQDILIKNNNLIKKSNMFLYELANIDSKFVPLEQPSTPTYISRDNDRLIWMSVRNQKTMDEESSNRVDFYNKLSKKYPDVNISIYAVSNLWHSKAVEEIGLDINDGERYIRKLKESLDKSVNFNYLKLKDMNDYDRYFFKTDHHWNIFGAYEGYKDIVNLLSRNYDSIGSPREALEFFKVPGVKLQGSMARLVANEDIVDELWDVKVGLPKYSIKINGNPVDKVDKKSEYLKGDFNRAPFTGHYGEYFRYDYGEVSYHFENNKGRNLLILGDSITNNIENLIASHYDNTYVIDFRYYKDAYGKDFDFGKFVKENDIKDVLFLMTAEASVLESNKYNMKW